MTIIICILLTIVTFAAGYAFGTMRSQREAVAAKAELAAARKHADEAPTRSGGGSRG